MNLPKIVFNIITGCACIVTVMAGLVSCRKDDLTDGIDFTIPGEDVTLTVPISLPKMDVQTRADIAQNDLDKVETLWIATFSAGTGEMTSKTNDVSGGIGWHKIKIGNPSDYNEPHAQPVELNTKSGSSYIVAVANVETNKGVKKSSFNGNQTGDTQQLPTEQSLDYLLNEVTTWDQFLDIAVVTPSTHNLINAPTTPLPMAGAYTNLAPSDPHSTTKEWEKENFQPYTIPYTKSGEYEFKNGAIHLRRLVSQVKFNLKPGDAVSIIPHSYQVVNVPKYSWLYERAKKSEDESGLYTANFGDNCSENTRSDYYSTPEVFIANDFRLIDPTDVAKGYTFNYWQSENKHTGTATIGSDLTTDKQKYNLRDQIYNAPGTSPEHKSYETSEFQQNALFTSLTGNSWTPNNMATYVLISCTVEYKGTNNGQINVNDKGETGKNDSNTPVTRVGEATYLIHLGYVGADVNDFNCYRNTKYTYNVTINGVDDIRVEAYGEGDTPGVEGMVDDSEKPIRWLDCHYHAYNIQLSADDLKAWDKQVNGTGFRFIITTYDTGVEKTFTEEDFKDVDFQDCDFSTIKKYVDWIELRPTTGENELAAYKPRGHEDGLTFNLIDASKGITDKQKSGSGWYTLFVKEYTYDASESDPANESIGSDGIPVWKSYVNQAPRSFYIRVTKRVSADTQSVYTRSKYSGRQQSIMTYYDRNKITEPSEAGKTRGSAVGVEHINESLGLNLRQSFSASTNSVNGRLNCWNFSKSTHTDGQENWAIGSESGSWSSFVNMTVPQLVPEIGSSGNQPATHPVYLPEISKYTGPNRDNDESRKLSPYNGSLPEYYIEAIAACMNRNRDNNGDGEIQENEMRWYVPTMGKYLRIFLGQEALSPDQLINYNSMPNRPETINGQNIDRNVKWGRYLFFGNDNRVWWAMEGLSTSDYKRFNDVSWRAKPWEVRCIRNLGTNLNNVNEIDQTIPAYTFIPNDGIAKNGGKVYPTYYQTTQLRSTRYSGNGTGSGQMPVHTIAENYNSIYQGGFEISNPENNIAGAKYDGTIAADDWKLLIDYINNNPDNHHNPCTQKGDRWRIPNVRELAIMKNLGVINMDSGQNSFLCCSMGIINGGGIKILTVNNDFLNSNTQQFFNIALRLDANEFNIQQDFKNTNYVRCVRDL